MTIRRLFLYILRAAVWAAALGFGFGFWLGPLSASGAALGGIVALFCEGRRVDLRGRGSLPLAAPCLAIPVIMIPVLPWLLALFAPAIVPVAAVNALIGFCAGFVTVSLSSWASCLSGLPLVEALAASLCASIPFLESKGGHFLRPRWLSDTVLSQGWDPALVLSYIGGVILLLSLAGLLSVRRDGEDKGGGRAGIALVLFATGGILFFLPSFLAPVPPAPVPPPKPPMSFAGNPPPPPPPQAEPIAAVQFSEILRPSPRLHGFYFRKPDPETLTNAMPSDGRVIRSTIWYLKPGAGPFVLPGESLEMPVDPAFERARSASWSATRIETVSNREDFMIHPDDDSETILEATDPVGIRTNDPTSSSAEDEKFLASFDAVISGKEPPPEKGVIRALLGGGKSPSTARDKILTAVLLAEWVASHGCLDDSSTNAPRSSEEFLRTGMKGRSGDFSRLTVDLLKARGIEARMSEGYFVPADQSPDDRLIVTDAEASVWPEVCASDGVWIPIPVRPWKTSSHDDPPPQEDRKKEIFDALAKNRHTPKKEEAQHGRTPSSHGIQFLSPSLIAMLPALLAVFLSIRFAVPLRFLLMANPVLRPRVLLGWMAGIVTRRHPRAFGQGWADYAENVLKPRNVHRGILMREVIPFCSLDRPLPMGRRRALRFLIPFLLWGVVPNFLQFTISKIPQSTKAPTP